MFSDAGGLNDVAWLRSQKAGEIESLWHAGAALGSAAFGPGWKIHLDRLSLPNDRFTMIGAIPVVGLLFRCGHELWHLAPKYVRWHHRSSGARPRARHGTVDREIDPHMPAALMGTEWEPRATELFTLLTGLGVSPAPLVPSDDCPWLAGSPDGDVDDGSGFETKTACRSMYRWIPIEHLVQTYVQMACTGRRRTYYWVIFVGLLSETCAELPARLWIIEWREQFWQWLSEMLQGAWRCILEDRVPADRLPRGGYGWWDELMRAGRLGHAGPMAEALREAAAGVTTPDQCKTLGVFDAFS